MANTHLSSVLLHCRNSKVLAQADRYAPASVQFNVAHRMFAAETDYRSSDQATQDARNTGLPASGDRAQAHTNRQWRHVPDKYMALACTKEIGKLCACPPAVRQDDLVKK